VDPESTISPGLLTAAISAIGYEDVSVSLASTDKSSDYKIVNLPNKVVARTIASAVATVVDYDGEPEIEPVIKVIDKPLYVQMTGIAKRVDVEPVSIRFEDEKIVIDGEDIIGSIQSPEIADDELKRRIEKLLSELGVSDDSMTVESVTNFDTGTRTVTLQLVDEMTLESLPDEGVVEIFISDEAIGAAYDEEDSTVSERRRITVQCPKDKKLKGRAIVLRVNLKED
jgi:hypothetical protein